MVTKTQNKRDISHSFEDNFDSLNGSKSIDYEDENSVIHEIEEGSNLDRNSDHDVPNDSGLLSPNARLK